MELVLSESNYLLRPKFNFKVNKSVYIASPTYQFYWQYAIILG